MTYCGVVGHTLRREYTVISLSVNKAARLMCAYPDKVTCDRETFLHSKLEARNFILQEAKHLKGITAVGTVYEFREQSGQVSRPLFHDPSVISLLPLSQLGIVQAVNPYPILGRADEIRLYRRLLDEFQEVQENRDKPVRGFLQNHFNVLLITGEPRQGKTRLLEEMIFCTPDSVPINRFTLSNKDSKVKQNKGLGREGDGNLFQTPFATMRGIFYLPLGISDDSAIDEREVVLKSRLEGLNVPEVLCCLNRVFNVNFEMTAIYQTFNSKQKDKVLEVMLRDLAFLVRFKVHLLRFMKIVGGVELPIVEEIQKIFVMLSLSEVPVREIIPLNVYLLSTPTLLSIIISDIPKDQFVKSTQLFSGIVLDLVGHGVPFCVTREVKSY